jgi:hypothetical protein
MKDCLVSFSSKGRENYNKGLLRLIDSALEHWAGDILVYSTDHWLEEYKGVPIIKGLPDPEGIQSFTHQDMPYQFKVALIQKAIELGYDRIAWLDSSMVINKDITPLFGDSGVGVFHNLGHPLYKYISDESFHKTGITRARLMETEQIWGGALLFDFTKPNAVSVFEMIKEFSLNGSFREGGSVREGFVAHRHDQAVMSVLVHGKCNMYPYGTIVCPPHDKTFEYGNDIYLICRPNE